MIKETTSHIIYTKVDEAPELASASLLPIIQRFASAANIRVGTRDISLAGRILAAFSDRLPQMQKQDDDLAALGLLVKSPRANVIKLPNISASVPQLLAAISELQQQGYSIPDYPENPQTSDEKQVRKIFDSVKGSAVNPVLREGNSDRRAAKAVKAFAKANPHKMGDWRADSRTHVATMSNGDFFSNEVSQTLTRNCVAQIVFIASDGTQTILKDRLNFEVGTIVDTTFMSAKALDTFIDEEIKTTASQDLLFSVHLKATMMKVSDPIIFGRVIKRFLFPVFEKFGDEMSSLGVNPNSGLADLLSRVKENSKITTEINDVLNDRPPLYMVDSEQGITNLHVPSDVIIDASMPALIRAGGKGWGPDGKESDTVCVIPDSSYAPVYKETINFFKKNGKLNPAIAGTVQNVGLMAQKAEEYGSHPTTFEIQQDGQVSVILDHTTVLTEHSVEAGDIWRLASTRKAPIEDWVRLAIDRQRSEGCEAIFWLDSNRSHDAELIKYVNAGLEKYGAFNKFKIMAPSQATRITLETIAQGKNSIAVTGNVLRDYLTDLFPILELATSAKMLSIVKLMQGGGLFETGAGGSAPKHVQQLLEENHLRWDSLGEFCALAESFKFLADVQNNKKAGILGEAVEVATKMILNNGNSPGRKVGQPDNRDSHYWFARYWAEALADQNDDNSLSQEFTSIIKVLSDNQRLIIDELTSGRGTPIDLGGYYHPDPKKVASVMRPSTSLNKIIDVR
ncbi:MAG: NADP-dependent isocitrate dehydrogenase [Aestuariivita sp.]|nr:NADP-dependent isocitrate dehydrogenase [Aestuariivita sp.]